MEEKCLEFYFNENEYNEEKEQELIKEIKKEERVREVKLKVNRNEWGIYVVKANIYQRKFGTFAYDNKNENLNVKRESQKGKIEEVIFSKPENIKRYDTERIEEVIIEQQEKGFINKTVRIKEKLEINSNKPKQTKYEKYTNREYGVYQSQGVFKPY